jgi:predicted nucleic acid-binding Zn ribbon protein
MKKPQSIRSILEQTLKALEIDVPLKTYSILGAWNDVVGESVAEHSQPRTIRNRILFIDVSHPTWMQQLQFLKPTLLEKVNTFLGEPLIETIRFKLGKISPSIPSPSKSPMVEDEKLDQGTLNRIENLVQKFNDEEIGEKLREILIKGAKLQQRRKKLK